MAILRAPGHVIYTGWDRIDVEVVLVDEHRYAGELRAWDLEEDGTWSASMQWPRGPGTGNRLERHPSGRVRRLDAPP